MRCRRLPSQRRQGLQNMRRVTRCRMRRNPPRRGLPSMHLGTRRPAAIQSDKKSIPEWARPFGRACLHGGRCTRRRLTPFERDAFRVVFLKTSSVSLRTGEDLEVVNVTDVLAGVDVDPDGHSSLLSFRFPQWWGLGEISNSLTRWRLIASTRPIRAKIIGVTATRSTRSRGQRTILGFRAMARI